MTINSFFPFLKMLYIASLENLHSLSSFSQHSVGEVRLDFKVNQRRSSQALNSLQKVGVNGFRDHLFCARREQTHKHVLNIDLKISFYYNKDLVMILSLSGANMALAKYKRTEIINSVILSIICFDDNIFEAFVGIQCSIHFQKQYLQTLLLNNTILNALI